MRQIGTVRTERDATRFGAYLLTIGIDNTVEPTADSWAVWIANDDHLDKARGELSTFQANSNDARYGDAVQTANVLLANQQKAERRRRDNFVDVRTKSGHVQQWNAPITLVLIGISIIVSLMTHVWAQRRTVEEPAIVNALRIAPIVVVGDRYGWNDLDSIKHGEVWRLITPIFLHFRIMHLVFNMFWMRDLGFMVETRRGTLFMGLLVVVIAIASNLGQYYWAGPTFGGMSGVVYGLFGYVWIKGLTDPMAGIGIRQETAVFMLIWLGACMTGFLGPIANAAHVVGLGVGVVFAYVPHLVRRMKRG